MEAKQKSDFNRSPQHTQPVVDESAYESFAATNERIDWDVQDVDEKKKKNRRG
jgi:hypothetical protein